MKVKAILVSAATIAAVMIGLSPGTATAAEVDAPSCARTVLNPVYGSHIYDIQVFNKCNYVLTNVRAHVFNSKYKLDKYSPRQNLGPGDDILIKVDIELKGAANLTCGELQSPGGALFGQDCITR